MSSAITEELVSRLRTRSEAGLAKYGTTLDRTDLSPRQWITHAVEELLDGAGYLLCVDRELEAMRSENDRLRAENERMGAALRPLLELAQTLGLTAPVVAEPAKETLAAYTDTCEACAKEVCDCEPLIQEPAPVAPPETQLVGLTRGQIGEAIGCNPNSCSKWESEGIITRIPGTGTNAKNPVLYPENTPEILLEHRRANAEKMRAVASLVGQRNAKLLPTTTTPAPPASTPTETAFERSARARALATQTRSIPDPAFDTNESGRLAMTEEGKRVFMNAKSFLVARQTSGEKWQWDYLPTATSLKGGWEIVETWTRNGLGKWESTPINPGAVGTGNGITRGTNTGFRGGIVA